MTLIAVQDWPMPDPDPECWFCGHPKQAHRRRGGYGKCMDCASASPFENYNCNDFTEKSPARTEWDDNQIAALQLEDVTSLAVRIRQGNMSTPRPPGTPTVNELRRAAGLDPIEGGDA